MGVIIVLGGGIAGDEAAHAARNVDPTNKVVLVSQEPSPLYSACVLAEYVAGRIPRRRVFLRDPRHYERTGIQWLPSRHVVEWSADQRVLRTAGGEELIYDRLVLATGSRPMIPDIPGIQARSVFPLKTLQDADGIQRAAGEHAAVIGSGPIGIETAIALHQRGWKVSVVELMDRILPRVFDAPMAHAIEARLEGSGIRIFKGERLLEIGRGDRAACISTDKRELPAQLVVVVVGMRPRVGLVHQSGIELGPSGGIHVDEELRTSRADVWACGDCAETSDRITGERGLHMLWNNARLQGRVAGGNAAGASIKYAGSLNVTTVNVFGVAAASAGRLDGGEGSRHLLRQGPWGSLWLVFEEDRLVGVQALGRTERVGRLLGFLMRGGRLAQAVSMRSLSARAVWALGGLKGEIPHEKQQRRPDTCRAG